MADLAEGCQRRMEIMKDLNKGLMNKLTIMLFEHHAYAEAFKMAKERLAKEDVNVEDMQFVIKDVKNAYDRKTYNAPTVNEFAALIPKGSNADLSPATRDIILECRDSGVYCCRNGDA